MRQDGRKPDQLRPLKITKGFIPTAEGSVLIEMGRTRVICTASIEERVPQFLKDSGKGWVTAEYSMLPRSTSVRTAREAVQGRQSGRTLEIQRLIGRSLRSVMNTEVMGERTLWLDCDVIEADGGTRTASITGAFMAMADAVKYGIDRGLFTKNPIIDLVAAISVGVVDGAPALDLNYGEDYGADVDMNVVMTGSGRIVEVQGTAERTPFDRKALDNLLDLASKGLSELFERQRAELGALVIK